MLSKGDHNVKVTDFKVEFTEPKDGKPAKPYVFLLLEAVDGEQQGQDIGYKVFLLKKDGNPNNIAREILKVFGWDGKNLETLEGLGTTVAGVVVGERPWVGNDGQPRTSTEVMGVKGVVMGSRGREADKAELKNLSKLFATKSKVSSNNDDESMFE